MPVAITKLPSFPRTRESSGVRAKENVIELDRPTEADLDVPIPGDATSC
jgi:hypothetical protein